MSGSYIEQELCAEFGKIPPSLLPLGNRRLFQYQINLAPENEIIYISLPENYSLIEADYEWLNRRNVKVLKTPIDLTLGQAVVASLNLISDPLENDLHILFGDTLFNSIPNKQDVIAIAENCDSYRWARVDKNSVISDDESLNNIVCGYFHFSRPRELIRCITQEKWDFLQGINRYNSDVGLKLVAVDEWYDFGHVNTYYHSKTKFTTQRAFNSLKITKDYIEKSSENNLKIRGESNWFTTIPTSIRKYTPQYLGDNGLDSCEFFYRLEYLYNTSLSELYVFSEINHKLWEKILNSCFEFIDDCKSNAIVKNIKFNSLNELFNIKTRDRLLLFCEEWGVDKTEEWSFNDINEKVSINDMLLLAEDIVTNMDSKSSVMHGDFCFSNILYDFRTERLKTIDPRGVTPTGELSIYGDIQYDIAKLGHSVLGMYDWIIAGYHQTDIDFDKGHVEHKIEGEAKHLNIKKFFIEKVEQKYNIQPEELYAMQLMLFLSMLPLHSDDKFRQEGLFANAFRIYFILKGYLK